MESLAKVTKLREKRKRTNRKAAAFLRLRVEYTGYRPLRKRGSPFSCRAGIPFPLFRRIRAFKIAHTQKMRARVFRSHACAAIVYSYVRGQAIKANGLLNVQSVSLVACALSRLNSTNLKKPIRGKGVT